MLTLGLKKGRFTSLSGDGAAHAAASLTVSYDEFQLSLHMPGLISCRCVCLQLSLNTSSTTFVLFISPLLSHPPPHTHTHTEHFLANPGPVDRFLEGDVYPQQHLSLRHVAWVNNTVRPKTMSVPDDCNYL